RRPEPCGAPLPRLRRLDVAVAWRRARDEVSEEMLRGVRHVVDRALEGGFVRFRRTREAGDLSHELQRGGMDLLVRRRRLEVVQRFDVPTHDELLMDPMATIVARPPPRRRASRRARSVRSRTPWSAGFRGRGSNRPCARCGP